MEEGASGHASAKRDFGQVMAKRVSQVFALFAWLPRGQDGGMGGRCRQGEEKDYYYYDGSSFYSDQGIIK